jgi:hypothetical protein
MTQVVFMTGTGSFASKSIRRGDAVTSSTGSGLIQPGFRSASPVKYPAMHAAAAGAISGTGWAVEIWGR